MKTAFRSAIAIAIAAAALATAGLAQARVVVGDEIGCAVGGGGAFTCSASSATVGGGSEFGIGTPDFTALLADFSADVLDITAVTGLSLASTILQFTNNTNPFTEASLVSFSFSGITGFVGAERFGVNSDGVLRIDLQNTGWNNGARLSLSFAQQVNGVPEPTSLALVSAALFGAVAALRRRKPLA